MTAVEQLTEQCIFHGEGPYWDRRGGRLLFVDMLAGDVVDPEVAFLLGKDTNTFRDTLQALLQGNEGMRISRVSDADLRAKTLRQIAHRERFGSGNIYRHGGGAGDFERLDAVRDGVGLLAAIGVDRNIEPLPLVQLDEAVESRPAHHLRERIMPLRPAYFPDAAAFS